MSRIQSQRCSKLIEENHKLWAHFFNVPSLDRSNSLVFSCMRGSKLRFHFSLRLILFVLFSFLFPPFSPPPPPPFSLSVTIFWESFLPSTLLNSLPLSPYVPLVSVSNSEMWHAVKGIRPYQPTHSMKKLKMMTLIGCYDNDKNFLLFLFFILWDDEDDDDDDQRMKPLQCLLLQAQTDFFSITFSWSRSAINSSLSVSLSYTGAISEI